MKINNGQIETNPDNTFILRYPNDMLDGVIIDLDENYAFIPKSVDSDQYFGLEAQLCEEGIDVVVITDADMTEAPHCWVMQSMVKAVIQGAEVICKEAAQTE